MTYRYAIVAAAAIAALAAPRVALAQAHPNLSGTWIVDAAKSDQPAEGRVNGGGGRGPALPPNQMVITENDKEIAVSRGNQTAYYNVDGTERTGPPGGETKSTIAWDGDKLVVTWKREYYAGPDKGYVMTSGKDVYTLAGSTLIVERTTNEPSRTVKTVYTRAS